MWLPRSSEDACASVEHIDPERDLGPQTPSLDGFPESRRIPGIRHKVFMARRANLHARWAVVQPMKERYPLLMRQSRLGGGDR